MQIVVTEPPAAIVTATEAKSWSPVLATLSDGQVTALIAIVQAEFEPPFGWTGAAFGEQTIEARLDGFPCSGGAIALPCPPVSTVSSIVYLDENSTEQTLSAGAYTVAGLQTVFPRIVLKPSGDWPATAQVPDAVTITFTAGYASDDPRLLPAKQAAVLACAHLQSLAGTDPRLKTVVVDGVGRRDYLLTPEILQVLSETSDRLLQRYMVKTP